MTSDLRGDRRGGFYWRGGPPVPHVSVTKCLGAIAKPQLLSWAAKEAYYAVIKDPGISEQEAVQAHLNVRDKAASRGSTVHSIVEAYKTSGAVIGSVPGPMGGYADAFYQWIKDSHINIVEQEKTVFSDKYRYAGTMDILATLNGNSDLWVVDIKTNKAGVVYPEHHLQVSAYLAALREQGVNVKGGAVLALREDGKYSYHQIKENFPAFLAAKTLWEWQNEETCLKLGYLKGGE